MRSDSRSNLVSTAYFAGVEEGGAKKAACAACLHPRDFSCNTPNTTPTQVWHAGTGAGGAGAGQRPARPGCSQDISCMRRLAKLTPFTSRVQTGGAGIYLAGSPNLPVDLRHAGAG